MVYEMFTDEMSALMRMRKCRAFNAQEHEILLWYRATETSIGIEYIVRFDCFMYYNAIQLKQKRLDAQRALY